MRGGDALSWRGFLLAIEGEWELLTKVANDFKITWVFFLFLKRLGVLLSTMVV